MTRQPRKSAHPQPLPEYTVKDAKAEADAFIQLQENQKLEKVRNQLTLVHEAIKSAASKGLREVTYRKDLCEETLAILKSRGFKILDLGEHVASVYQISGWREKDAR
jgi:hypothetical protein